MVTPPKFSLPLLLSFNGGFVDTAGYLALQGLFTVVFCGRTRRCGARQICRTPDLMCRLPAASWRSLMNDGTKPTDREVRRR
jgi:hypothetical protein